MSPLADLMDLLSADAATTRPGVADMRRIVLVRGLVLWADHHEGCRS